MAAALQPCGRNQQWTYSPQDLFGVKMTFYHRKLAFAFKENNWALVTMQPDGSIAAVG